MIFCLGVTKGGTSWLHWALCQHRGVSVIPRKEIHYFAKQYGGLDRLTDKGRLAQFASHINRSFLGSPDLELRRVEPTDLDTFGSPWDSEMEEIWGPNGKGRRRFRQFKKKLEWYRSYLKGPINDDWYHSLFADLPERKWAFDFSTSGYMTTADGYRAMADFAEDTRAILILRDPIDRLWSHVRFQAALTNDLQSLHSWSARTIRYYTQHHYLAENSFYADAVEKLIDTFPPDRRLILSYDDLRDRPEDLFARVLMFLGLPEMPLPPREQKEGRVNVSPRVVMPSGVFADLAPAFESDLKRCADLGVGFVAPWIDTANAHRRQRTQFDLGGYRSSLRLALNVMREDKARRTRYAGPGARSDKVQM